MKLRISSYLSIYGLLLFYILLSGLAMFAISMLDGYNFRYIIGTIVIVAFVVVTYSINRYYFQKINLEPPKLIGLNRDVFRALLLGVLIAVVLNFPYRIYAVIISGDLEYLFLAFNVKIFVMALGASIFEEVAFRGTFLNFYKQKNKQYLGLIISSLLFGALHMTNSMIGIDITVLYILDIVIFGILYGLIYLNFGLVASIATHVTGNLIIDGFVQGTRYGFYYSSGIAVVLCIALFIRERRKQKHIL